MLRTLIFWFFLPLLAFGAAACCGSVACDDRDQNADTLFFRFAPTITPESIQTVYIVRTYTPDSTVRPRPTSLEPVRDTARLISAPVSPSDNDTLAIGNNAPFTATANRKLNAYSYEIYTLVSPADTIKALRFTVSNIQLQGGFNDEDGCCTYYKNTLKTIRLTNRKVVQTGYNLTSEGSERRYALLQP